MRISWLRRALLDLEAAEAYIARENPSAASGIVLGIVQSVTLLEDQPGLGRPGRLPGTRELVVPNTPFIVPYRIRGEAVEILRVYHTARKWPEQL